MERISLKSVVDLFSLRRVKGKATAWCSPTGKTGISLRNKKRKTPFRKEDLMEGREKGVCVCVFSDKETSLLEVPTGTTPSTSRSGFRRS